MAAVTPAISGEGGWPSENQGCKRSMVVAAAQPRAAWSSGAPEAVPEVEIVHEDPLHVEWEPDSTAESSFHLLELEEEEIPPPEIPFQFKDDLYESYGNTLYYSSKTKAHLKNEPFEENDVSLVKLVTINKALPGDTRIIMVEIKNEGHAMPKNTVATSLYTLVILEVLSWAEEKRASITNACMIKEIDCGPNQDLLQLYFYLTTSLLVHRGQGIKFYTFWIRIRASWQHQLQTDLAADLEGIRGP
uniref:Uncharacterized protein n=1 Tax=Oryza meridionalis TaxID=40149 RepID=A0A0E0EW47_9ORYZ